MTNRRDEVQVRTFATKDEILCLDGYQPDNGINSRNYERIIGDYWFPDKVKCCYLKPNGNLCHKDHKWGFVARLVDNSVTIVGNCCAIKKFGADSKMKADRSRYMNEKRRSEAFSQLADLLASKSRMVGKLRELVSRVKVLKNQVDDFTSKLGAGTLRQLVDMHRTGNLLVSIQGISYRDYIDEEGDKRRERTVTQHSIGRIRGLNCLSTATFSSIRSEVHAAETAFEKAGQLQSSANIKQIKAVISGFKAPDRVEVLVDELERRVAELVENDFLLLCFLSDDKTERYRLAQLALAQKGQDVGKEKAKVWLAEQEAQLAKSLGVDKVAVP